MQLRPYQEKYIHDIRHGLAKHRRIIAQLPTGGGKSFAFITCAQMAIKAGKTVLILSESRKIYSQIEKQIPQSIEINAGVKSVYIQSGSLYLGMSQTLRRRPAIIEQLQNLRENLIVIADEAHLGTHTKVLAALSAALLIGITATPNYDDAKHLTTLYNACITGPQISELVQDGYLCPYTHFARVGADMGKLEKGNDGEFTEASQELAFGNSALFDGLIEDLRKIPYTYCMVFCASIKHCEDVAAQLEHAGINCVTYHSRQEHAAYNLMQYETGRVRIMVSVGALTKGYDFPPTDLICMVRATTSLSLCWQIFGRASRPAPGKKRFTVLDYGSHQPRFGFWDMDMDWQKLWQKPKKRKRDTVGVAPVKECPECGALIPPGTMVCPFCAAVLEPPEKEMQQGVLVDLTAQCNALSGRLISSLSPPELALYATVKNKKAYAIRIAKAHEQAEPGWLTRFSKAMNYKEGWVRYQLETITDEKIEFYDVVLR